jgi:hypothetical protein
MQIIITSHVKKRLRDDRQGGILIEDVQHGARAIPGTIPIATRFRGFLAISGRSFDLVAKDIAQGRLVITVIGK